MKKLYKTVNHLIGNQIIKKNSSLFIAILLSIGYALAGSLISLHRHWQYETFYFDFGIFDSAIWQVAHFIAPIIHHISLGEGIIFRDHLSPSIFLLSPIFWIIPYSDVLLIIQACFVAASGFILFLIGRHVLKNNFYALSILLIYFLFVGLQNAVITDFHEVTIATFFFMITFLCIAKQKKTGYFISLLLLLGFKESLFLLGMGMAVVIWFLYPAWRKIAVATVIISLLWGVVSIKVIIPFFSQGEYHYANDLPTDPVHVVSSFVNYPIKQHTLFYSFASYGFLPVLSPSFFPLIFQDFFVRFYPEQWQTRWGLGFHYSALLAAIMAVSSIYSVRFLQRRLKNKWLMLLVLLAVLNSLFLYRFVLHGPFALAYNPAFYKHTKDFTFLDDVVKEIPADATIMTQNNLAAHFTHQKVWLLLSDKKKYPIEYYTTKQPEYILIDTREGQNPNNHFGIKDMDVLLEHLRKDNNYTVTYDKNGQLIFKRQRYH